MLLASVTAPSQVGSFPLISSHFTSTRRGSKTRQAAKAMVLSEPEILKPTPWQSVA